MSKRVVGVIGGRQADDEALVRAERVGTLLAHRGCVLVTGGLGGVMEAACRGAQTAGGLTLGLLPGAAVGEANAYVDVAVATGLGDARNALIANTAEGFVAVGGSWGTLSEIAFALTRAKPVVSLGSFAAGLPVIPADTPEEAVDLLLAALDG